MERDRDVVGTEGMLYRLEVAGRITDDWAAWFEADAIAPAGEDTILEVRVADQAQLYGRLRRIHDLNLRLVSVTLVSPPTAERPRGSTPEPDPEEISR